MATKTINARIVHKHDTEANWKKAINFVPKKAEIIVYDKDDVFTYTRIKIGDGATNINDLPFEAPVGIALNQTETQIVASTSLTFAIDSEHNTNFYASTKNAITISGFEKDQTYKIIWDGTTYYCYSRANAATSGSSFYSWRSVGNANDSVLNGYFAENADYPFAITYNRWKASETYVYAVDGSTATTHTIEIYKITADYKKIEPNLIYNYLGGIIGGETGLAYSIGGSRLGDSVYYALCVGAGNSVTGAVQNAVIAGASNTVGGTVIADIITGFSNKMEGYVAYSSIDGYSNTTKNIYYSNIQGAANTLSINSVSNIAQAVDIGGVSNTVNDSSSGGPYCLTVRGNKNTITGKIQYSSINGYGNTINVYNMQGSDIFANNTTLTSSNSKAVSASIVRGVGHTITFSNGNFVNSAVFGSGHTITDVGTVFVGGYHHNLDIAAQTAFGKFSAADTTAVFKIGWGTSDTDRKNMFTVHTDGRATVGAAPTGDMDVSTKTYTDDKFSKSQRKLYRYYIEIEGTELGTIQAMIISSTNYGESDTSLTYQNLYDMIQNDGLRQAYRYANSVGAMEALPTSSCFMFYQNSKMCVGEIGGTEIYLSENGDFISGITARIVQVQGV